MDKIVNNVNADNVSLKFKTKSNNLNVSKISNISNVDKIQKIGNGTFNTSGKMQKVSNIEDFFMDIFNDMLFDFSKTLELFNANKISGINESDISDVNRSGADSENIMVTLKNGDVYIFDKQKRIVSVDKENYHIYYNYDVNDYEKSQITNMFGISSNETVNFVATVDVKGEKFKYYSVGNSDISNDVNFPINFSEQYQNFSQEILSRLSSSMFGIIIGDKDLSPYNPLGGSYGAYATGSNSDGEKYIFIPNDADANRDYYKYNTPLHETAHIIQTIIDIDEIKLNNLYKEYKDILPVLDESCYNVNLNYDETPNINEFFADAVTNYYLNPIELERYIPELYDFINDIFGG